MKKVVIFMIMILLGGLASGQSVNKLKYVQHMYGGVSVGGGSTKYTANDPNEVIDSIRVISGVAYIYSGGTNVMLESINALIEDSLDAYRASAIPLKTTVILGQTTKVTIGWHGATGVDFLQPDVASSNAYPIDLGAIIPAKARVIQIEIVCTEALAGSGAHEILFTAGNATGGAQFIASISCDATNEVAGIIDPHLPQAVIMNWASATNIWIGSDPDANWDTYTAGKWTVYITYIEYTDI
jgi:hypothetical protein